MDPRKVTVEFNWSCIILLLVLIIFWVWVFETIASFFR